MDDAKVNLLTAEMNFVMAIRELFLQLYQREPTWEEARQFIERNEPYSDEAIEGLEAAFKALA